MPLQRDAASRTRQPINNHRALHSLAVVQGGNAHSGYYWKQSRCRLYAASTVGIVTVSAVVYSTLTSTSKSACQAALAQGSHGTIQDDDSERMKGVHEDASDQVARDNYRPGLGFVVLRLVRHLVVFVPLAFLYFPFCLAGASAHDLWWKWAIYALESSGPAFVKLGQWAATRSDMFPSELCSRLSQLHSGARTHALSLSEAELLGILDRSNYTLVSIDKRPLGSGCIAQVCLFVCPTPTFPPLLPSSSPCCTALSPFFTH